MMMAGGAITAAIVAGTWRRVATSSGLAGGRRPRAVVCLQLSSACWLAGMAGNSNRVGAALQAASCSFWHWKTDGQAQASCLVQLLPSMQP
eukprot:COSAG01_NODE_42960_length_434_cov_3.391045_1_plen_91_part_00